jgi:outer membrane autotransporter protein
MHKLLSCFAALAAIFPVQMAIAQSRIMGGEVVPMPPPSEPSPAYPWMGSIQRSGEHHCGGTLIAPDYILTSAHCFFDNPSDSAVGTFTGITEFKVRLGTQNYKDANAETISVAEVFIHPDYRRVNRSLSNDIALIRLARPSSSRNFIQLTQVEYAPGQTAIAIGWGLTSNRAPFAYSDLLKQVSLPLVSRQVCQQRLLDVFGPNINSSMICAGLDQGGQDTCLGDSGGPLFIQDPRGRYVQLGIVSFGDGCGKPNRPGVYSNVAELYSFILKIIAQATAQTPTGPQQPTIVSRLEESAATPNQRAVARTLDQINITGTADLTAVYLDLFFASSQKRQRAFESLMPRTAFGQVRLSQDFDRTITRQLKDRVSALQTHRSAGQLLQEVDISGLRPLGGLSSTPDIGAMQPALGAARPDLQNPGLPQPQTSLPRPTDKARSPANLRRWSTFLAGTLDFGTATQAISSERADVNLRSFSIGMDYRLGDRSYLGLIASHGSGQAEERNLSKLESNSLGLSLYGTTEFGSGGYATGYLGYRTHQFDTNRLIYLPQEIRRATGDVNGQQWSAGLDLGWQFKAGRLLVGPSVGFRHSRLRLNDYAERGAGGVSLRLDDRTEISSRGTIELNAAYVIPVRWGQIIPSLRFGLEHEFDSGRPFLSASFLDAPDVPFQIRGGNFDRTWFVFNPGLTIQLGDRASLGFSYQTDLSRSDSNQHSVSGGFRIHF